MYMFTQWVAAAPLKAALALLAVLVAARTGVFIHSIRAYREKTKADRCLAPRTFLSLPAGSAPVRRLEFFKINDEVMGGRSTSSVTAKGGDVTFSGVINTNGGGFASFRTLGARSAGSDDEAPLGLPAECATVEVAATGDGRRYKVTLHVADSWAMSLPVWGADFVTRGGRQTFRLPLRSFVPTRQGRVVKAPPLSAAAVTGVGFSLSLYTADGKPNKEFGDGPFELTVHGVEIKR